MARTRKEKNLAMVLKLCEEQQEQVGRFLMKLLNIKGKKGHHGKEATKRT